MARWLFAWGQYTDVADSVNQFNAVWVIDKDSIPLGGDFDLDRFILRRATVDFYQRFQRQVVQLVVYRGTLFYGDDERVIHSQTINWRHSPCLMIGDELLWLGAKPRWGAMRPSVKRSRCRHGTATAAAIGKQITGCVGCWVAWILDRFNLKFNKWVRAARCANITLVTNSPAWISSSYQICNFYYLTTLQRIDRPKSTNFKLGTGYNPITTRHVWKSATE